MLSYESLNNNRLLPKLPVIIVLNGRSFRKMTSLIEKPFSFDFLEAMSNVAVKLMSEIDGSIFCYSFNDELIIVARNDQHINTEIWFDGFVQKIVSAAASIASIEFSRAAKEKKLDLLGDPIFVVNTFVVPNITEAINYMIYKQQVAFQTSLSLAAFYELSKKYDSETVKQTLSDKTSAAKADILFEECNIEFNNYALPFRRGIVCFRAPKIMEIDGIEQIRHKLMVDMEIPLFTKDAEFLSSIFKTGRDIFRA